MMKRRLQIYTVLAFILVSCRDEDDPVVPKEPTCELKTFVETYPDYNLTYSLSLSYDDQGRVIVLREQEDYEGDIYAYEIHFQYEGNKLISAEYYKEESSVDYLIGLTYQGEELQKLTLTSSYEGNADIDEYRLYYENGNLFRIENWDNYSDGDPDTFTLFGSEEFVYEGGNVAERYESNAFIGDEVVQYRYKYDNNPNPFYRNMALLIWKGSWSKFLSQNNVVQESYESDDYTTTFQYEYNDQGWPTNMTFENADTQIELGYDCGSR